jgi:phosphatidate phosphatase PAH1
MGHTRGLSVEVGGQLTSREASREPRTERKHYMDTAGTRKASPNQKNLEQALTKFSNDLNKRYLSEIKQVTDEKRKVDSANQDYLKTEKKISRLASEIPNPQANLDN